MKYDQANNAVLIALTVGAVVKMHFCQSSQPTIPPIDAAAFNEEAENNSDDEEEEQMSGGEDEDDEGHVGRAKKSMQQTSSTATVSGSRMITANSPNNYEISLVLETQPLSSIEHPSGKDDSENWNTAKKRIPVKIVSLFWNSKMRLIR